MNVGGELTWHIVVDDGLDSLDIQTTRSEIGSEEVLNLSVLEVLESLQTLEEGGKTGDEGERGVSRVPFPSTRPKMKERLTCS